MTRDNLYKLITPEGISGIQGFICIGPGTENILNLFSNRRAQQDDGLYYGTLVSPGSGEAVDEVLIASQRTSGILHLTTHGGRAVGDELKNYLKQIGFSESESVDFYKENRIITDVLNAVTMSVCREGVIHFCGYFSGEFENRLREISEMIRKGQYNKAILSIDKLIDGWKTRYGFMHPPTVFLVGPENAGKSSLFNRIIGFDRVIVTDIPGTTTDYVDETVLSEGYPLRFADSAGFPVDRTSSQNPSVNFEADLFRVLAEQADYIVVVYDIGALSEVLSFPGNLKQKIICTVLNKDDENRGFSGGQFSGPVLALSAKNGTRTDELMSIIRTTVLGLETRGIGQGFFTPEQVKSAEKVQMLLNDSDNKNAALLLDGMLDYD